MKRSDSFFQAKKHPIRRDVPSPDFFEGALLGNGGLGCVLCTRPDALMIHFGHNSIWDIRLPEDQKDKVGTFEEIWQRILETPGSVHREAWYQAYDKAVTGSYLNNPFPRPYPAGTLYLFFDLKHFELLGHSLDISTGLVTVTFRDAEGRNFYARAFVDARKDVLHLVTTDEAGSPCSLFYRMLVIPHTPDSGLPATVFGSRSFTQQLPFSPDPAQVSVGAACDPRDRGFSLSVCTQKMLPRPGGRPLDFTVSGSTEFRADLFEGPFPQVLARDPDAPQALSFEEARISSAADWQSYWACSGVILEDDFLEELWYHTSYFIRCSLREDTTCPGLFGNFMFGSIGTAWHGDYHMNYNTQQPFWGLMAANRLNQHFPYIRLVEHMIPVSRAWARDFYRLPGCCFPHSAYPVDMTVMPYPSCDWGWEVFETPWTVQSLWWHYTYTGDRALLRSRLFPPIRQATAFMAAYMTRPGANPTGDDRYHLFPTIVPELYGLSEHLDKNLDGLADLTLTKFLFRAYRKAVEDLEHPESEKELYETVGQILNAFPEYPTAESRHGRVYTSVQSEDPDHVVYNAPANLMAIFPGEDVDAQTSDTRALEIARRSWTYHYNEGGNDIVFYPLIGARLGILDLERFKRQVRYAMLPDGSVTDRVVLSGGRYGETCSFDFMRRCGIWIENFSLYAVVDECLLQGHTDTLRLFPNWDRNRKAEFTSLRTRGAFLVDSACSRGEVEYVSVTAEIGGLLQIENPWPEAMDGGGIRYRDPVIRINTRPGERILLKKA